MNLEKLASIDRFSWIKAYMEKATESEINKCNEELSKYCECGYNDEKDIFSDEECYFYWGAIHGVMVTNGNGMSRRYYHYLTLGGESRRADVLLQYHPDCYEIEESEDSHAD